MTPSRCLFTLTERYNFSRNERHTLGTPHGSCTVPSTGYCSLEYSALACFRTGMPGSASFHSVKKS
jgi:hypothetical protein